MVRQMVNTEDGSRGRSAPVSSSVRRTPPPLPTKRSPEREHTASLEVSFARPMPQLVVPIIAPTAAHPFFSRASADEIPTLARRAKAAAVTKITPAPKIVPAANLTSAMKFGPVANVALAPNVVPPPNAMQDAAPRTGVRKVAAPIILPPPAVPALTLSFSKAPARLAISQLGVWWRSLVRLGESRVTEVMGFALAWIMTTSAGALVAGFMFTPRPPPVVLQIPFAAGGLSTIAYPSCPRPAAPPVIAVNDLPIARPAPVAPPPAAPERPPVVDAVPAKAEPVVAKAAPRPRPADAAAQTWAAFARRKHADAVASPAKAKSGPKSLEDLMRESVK